VPKPVPVDLTTRHNVKDLQGDCPNLSLDFSMVNSIFLSKRYTDEHPMITNLRTADEAEI
jgi:hypothetical protein